MKGNSARGRGEIPADLQSYVEFDITFWYNKQIFLEFL